MSQYSNQMLGTWKVTFTSDTEFTITFPDGASASGTLNSDFAAKFGDPDPVNNPNPVVVYFGNTPTSNDRVGLTAIHSAIKITGTGYPINEDLVTNVMSDLLVTAQVSAAVLQVFPEEAKYWINWSLPAADFLLEQSMDLGADEPWADLPFPVTFATKAGRSRLLLESEVLNPTTNFFRMIKPAPVTPPPADP